MITPDNQIPLDDTDNNDKEDQPSQQDIHSNGFDEENEPIEDDGSSDVDKLQQASDASEPSFTLDDGE